MKTTLSHWKQWKSCLINLKKKKMLIMVINNNQQSLSMVLTLCVCVHNTKTPKSIFHSMMMDDNQIIIIIIIRYSGRISQPRFSFLLFFIDNFQTWNDLKTFQNTNSEMIHHHPATFMYPITLITLFCRYVCVWYAVKKFGTHIDC